MGSAPHGASQSIPSGLSKSCLVLSPIAFASGSHTRRASAASGFCISASACCSPSSEIRLFLSPTPIAALHRALKILHGVVDRAGFAEVDDFHFPLPGGRNDPSDIMGRLPIIRSRFGSEIVNIEAGDIHEHSVGRDRWANVAELDPRIFGKRAARGLSQVLGKLSLGRFQLRDRLLLIGKRPLVESDAKSVAS